MLANQKKFDIDNFFEDYLNSPEIVKNRDVLDAAHIPDELPHRDDQIRTIAEILVVTLKNSNPSNLFIYGKTGTGKTAVVKHVSKKLTEKCSQVPSINTPTWVYINCNQIKTGYRVLATIYNRLNPQNELPPTGLPRDIMLEKLFKILDEKLGNSICFIVLDEIDCLKTKKSKDNVLYILSRINENLKKCRVNLIGISNILNFKDDLDPRVLSSLCEEEMVFPAYNATQLNDILKARVEKAFHKGVVSDGAIQLISALAAGENGDARRALALLRKSTEFIERRSLTELTVDHVYEAQEQLDSDKTVEFIKELPIQQKVILIAIYLNHKFRNGQESKSGDIYNTYCELVKQSFTLNKLSSRRVTDLVKELDLAGIVRSHVTSFGRKGGRTRMVGLLIQDSDIQKSLGDDERWSDLLSYVPSYIRCPDINLYDGRKYKSLL